MDDKLSYERAGVNIDIADAAKRDMASSLATGDRRVLNSIGAFASLLDGRFPGYREPLLVFKVEEPGSKQKLAFQHGRVSSICYDLINHLINDIAVVGATPIAVQDAIICGKLEKETVNEIVRWIAEACREQGCSLTGGETSEQPGVLAAGVYVLVASIIGVVEREKVVDGSKIALGDHVLAVASNGLHTNGYSLVRALLEQRPEIAAQPVEGESFFDAIMKPHRCYYQSIRGLFDRTELTGMAHITGGGIAGNLSRILPEGLSALIDLSRLRVLPVFRAIREAGNVEDADMLRTFNLGIGLTLVVKPGAVSDFQRHLLEHGCDSYVVGEVVKGNRDVVFENALRW